MSRAGRLRRMRWLCVLCAACCLAGPLLQLCLGEQLLGPVEALRALIGGGDPQLVVVVREWRLPRAFAALVLGAALGTSGAIFQTLTRNPLASPDVVGFSTGSYTGALLVLLLVGNGTLQVAAGSLAGGLLTAGVVFLLAWRGGMAGFRLIVVGIAVSALLGSVNAWLLLRSRSQQAMQVSVWGVGSLSDVDIGALGVCSGLVMLMLLGTALLSRSLHELELGDEAATAHGVRVRQVWVCCVVLGVGLTAVVTSVAGPITFLALAAPQVAQRVTRWPGLPLAASGLTGAALLVAADLAAQHLLPEPVPVGLVTVVLGGAFLVHLVLAERRVLR